MKRLHLNTLAPVPLRTDSWFTQEILRKRWDALRILWCSDTVQESRRLAQIYGLFGISEPQRILLTNLQEDARVLKQCLNIYGVTVAPLDDPTAVDSYYPERLAALRKRMT